jgi:hypothetical protein
MAETGTTCPHCGVVLAASARFCGGCGAALPASEAAPPRAAQTMLGIDGAAVRAATAAIQAERERAKQAAAALAAQPPRGEHAAQPPRVEPAERAGPAEPPQRAALGKTMLGISPDKSAVLPPAAAAAAGAGSPDGGVKRAQPAAADRDVLPRGVAPGSQARVTATTATTATGAADPDRAALPPMAARPGATMLGMTMPGGGFGTEAAATSEHDALPDPDAAPAQFGTTRTDAGTLLGLSGPAPSNAPSLPPPPGVAARNNASTMLGMSMPNAAAFQSAPADRLGQGRTMLGVPMAALSPLPPPPPPSGAPGPRDSGQALDRTSQEPDSGDRASQPRHGARPWWPFALAGLALVALVAMLMIRLSGRTAPTDVTARIVPGEGGESLVFEVPRAPQGSRLRFGGQEQPLVAGRAQFPLAADSLRVGDNVVLADVIKPNGETTSARITLAVFYRIWVDTAALRADRSALDVVVTALPGTRVTLEGEEVKLDAQGRATRSYSLDVAHDAKAGMIDHVVHYRMQPPAGETVVDELHTQIPVAMMQIDRPGREVVTDRGSIEIAGAVGRDTKVSVDGVNLLVKDQRFLYSLPLPKPGTYKPRVVASASGKAPVGVTLNIQRVRDLAEAAREFVTDPSLTYAKLAPNPSIYRGQAIALEGRVYAFDARAGSSVIQMLTRPCPSSQRCSLWVVDPQAAEVGVDRWIRVLGVVEGEQQFRSEKNEVVTVPKIVARFILPAKP